MLILQHHKTGPQWLNVVMSKLGASNTLRLGATHKSRSDRDKAPSRLLILGHHKTGTRWLIAVMSKLAASNGFRFDATDKSPWDREKVDGCDVMFIGNASYDHLNEFSGRAVHIIRNPLDIVVSGYYSHLNSHNSEGWPELEKLRQLLCASPKDAGMWLEATFVQSRNFQIVDGRTVSIGPLAALERWNWDDPRFLTIRMEDLTAKPIEQIQRMFEFVGEQAPHDLLAAVEASSFEKLSGGRKLGERDDNSHYRSGLPDQWRSELPVDLARALQMRFHDLLERHYPQALP